jgi:hypothetical protein
MCSTKKGPIFDDFLDVGNVQDSTGVRDPTKTSHLRSWVHCIARGYPTRTTAVGNPHQLDGGHFQSGRPAMGTRTGAAVDGRREALVISVPG